LTRLTWVHAVAVDVIERYYLTHHQAAGLRYLLTNPRGIVSRWESSAPARRPCHAVHACRSKRPPPLM